MLGQRHAALRNGTSALHAELDATVTSSQYFASIAGYGEYLHRLRAFQRDFDCAALRCGTRWPTKWRVDQHVGWLDRDLAALGLTSRSPASGCAAKTLALNTTSALLGALYVVVGSGLGARVLLARARALALPNSGGTLYLESLSRVTDWRAFLAFLESAPSISEPLMIEGAAITFEHALFHIGEGVVA
ncbi:MAG: biliverdin-producing heme oxygenase [Hyphomicrobiaceae bacterium]